MNSDSSSDLGRTNTEHVNLTPEDTEALVQALCEEYLQMRVDGSSVTVESFAQRYPALEEELLELLPTIVLLNRAGSQNRFKRKDGMVVRGPDSFDRLGDYQIRGELGRGGMGIVFDAYQPSLDREVAIKVLPRQLDDDEHKERFLAEAKICARLHHSNIAPVYSVGEDQGVVFYAMEKLDGTPLDQYVTTLQQRRIAAEDLTSEMIAHEAPEPLTINDVVDIGIQISEALEYAHQNGVTHRDIKPANLIRGKNGRVWLTDFGLAVNVSANLSASSSGISGTLRYVAPERFDGAVDAPTGDVYSLGVTLMELLTGKAAFSAHRRSELLEQIRKNEFTPLSDHRTIGEDLISVLSKAASLDPKQRYPSAAALRDDLLRFTQGRPVTANPLGPLGRAWRWYQSNRAIASMSLATAVSLLTAAVVSSVFYLYSSDQLQQEQVIRSEAMNASKVAHEAIDEIFQQLNIGTGLAGVESLEYNVADTERNTHLLNQLTRFYEQLSAKESGASVSFDPVFARRKVGQIRMRVGEYEKAILDFSSALTRLEGRLQSGSSTNTNMTILRAQLINEKGLAKRILGKQQPAQACHLEALELLQQWKDSGALENESGRQTSEQNVDFEIARTLYFLAYRMRPGLGPESYPPEEPHGSVIQRPRPDDDDSRKYVQQAIASLKRTLPDSIDLVAFDDPTKLPNVDFHSLGNLADILHLLALCYREAAHDNRMLWTPEDEQAHARSISLLTLLTLAYPNNTTYQYDLMRAYAEMDVINPPIGGAPLEASFRLLNQSITMGEQLVQRYPNVTDFQSELSHAYNKLARLLERKAMQATKDEAILLDQEIEKAYRQAYQHQLALVKINPRAHAYKVWAAMFAIRCARTRACRQVPDRRNRLVARATSMLNVLPEPEQNRLVVQELLEHCTRLSLLGVADPPAVD